MSTPQTIPYQNPNKNWQSKIQNQLGIELWQILSLISLVLIISSILIWYANIEYTKNGASKKRLMNQAKAEVFLDFQTLSWELKKPVRITKATNPDACFSHLQNIEPDLSQIESKQKQIQDTKINLELMSQEIDNPSQSWQTLNLVFLNFLDKANQILENQSKNSQLVLKIQQHLSNYCSNKEKLSSGLNLDMELLADSDDTWSQQYLKNLQDWLANEGDLQSPDFVGFFVQPKFDYTNQIKIATEEFEKAITEFEKDEKQGLSKKEMDNLNLIFISNN